MLSKKQVAEKLGVSISTIERWMKARVIPYSLLNGIVRFDEKKIDVWVEKKTVRMKSIID